MNASNTTVWATRKGGSVPVGAMAWSAGIFRNDCTTATKQFRPSAMGAVMTWMARHFPTR
jgi:hypothetical protein